MLLGYVYVFNAGNRVPARPVVGELTPEPFEGSSDNLLHFGTPTRVDQQKLVSNLKFSNGISPGVWESGSLPLNGVRRAPRT